MKTKSLALLVVALAGIAMVLANAWVGTSVGGLVLPTDVWGTDPMPTRAPALDPPAAEATRSAIEVPQQAPLVVSGRLLCEGAVVDAAWAVQGCACTGDGHRWQKLPGETLEPGEFVVYSAQPVAHGMLFVTDDRYEPARIPFSAGQRDLAVTLQRTGSVVVAFWLDSAAPIPRLRSAVRGSGRRPRRPLVPAAADEGAAVARFAHHRLASGGHVVTLWTPEAATPLWEGAVDVQAGQETALDVDLRGRLTMIDLQVTRVDGTGLGAWGRVVGAREAGEDLQLGPKPTPLLSRSGTIRLLVGLEGYVPVRVHAIPPRTDVVLHENTEVMATVAAMPALRDGVRAIRVLRVEDAGLGDADLARFSADRTLADLGVGDVEEWPLDDPVDAVLVHPGARLHLRLDLVLGDHHVVASEGAFVVTSESPQRCELQVEPDQLQRALRQLFR